MHSSISRSSIEHPDRDTTAPWTEERLDTIMRDIHRTWYETAAEYRQPGNDVLGANIAGFQRVADAMVAMGLV